MIQQHFYTRERRGLYKNSAGYDTVAKSAGLSDAFVTKQIHPLCVYSGGGKPAFTLAHFPCGRMLFGRAVHITDFTGQRTAFFMHNYIFPASRVGEFLADIEKLLCARFEESCPADPPELCELPTGPREIPARFLKLYKSLPEGARQTFGFCATDLNAVVFPEENFDTYEIFISKKIQSQPPKIFFAECEFWRARAPQLEKTIARAEAAWLEKKLDTFTAREFILFPEKVIRHGKNTDYAALYVQISILKAVCAALKSKKNFSLRYILGNYALSDEDYSRVVRVLRRIFKDCISQTENIEFLFRERRTGKFDTKGFEGFTVMEKS